MPFCWGSAERGFFKLFYDWSLANCKTGKQFHQFVNRRTRAPVSKRAFITYAQTIQQSSTTESDDQSKPASQEEPALSSYLRQLMRKLPHSVVVATSAAVSPDRSAPPQFRGMTLSSFTTLTLTPMPIVTFNIRRPSKTLNAISQSKQFLIHILSATESGARVADAFTKGNGQNSFLNKTFEVLKRQGTNNSKSLDPPLLAADGIAKILRCEVLENKGLIEVGDHVLILGKVISIIEPSAQKDANIESRGLCYLDREYRQVGPVIKLSNDVSSSLAK